MLLHLFVIPQLLTKRIPYVRQQINLFIPSLRRQHSISLDIPRKKNNRTFLSVWGSNKKKAIFLIYSICFLIIVEIVRPFFLQILSSYFYLTGDFIVVSRSIYFYFFMNYFSHLSGQFLTCF